MGHQPLCALHARYPRNFAGKYIRDAGGHDFDYCRLQMMFRWQAALRIRKRPDFGSRQGASCEDCDKGRHHS